LIETRDYRRRRADFFAVFFFAARFFVVFFAAFFAGRRFATLRVDFFAALRAFFFAGMCVMRDVVSDKAFDRDVLFVNVHS
jgi:hypothetical protein